MTGLYAPFSNPKPNLIYSNTQKHFTHCQNVKLTMDLRPSASRFSGCGFMAIADSGRSVTVGCGVGVRGAGVGVGVGDAIRRNPSRSVTSVATLLKVFLGLSFTK